MDNELYHHGVKGMKWGVRKERDKTSNHTSTYDRYLVKQLKRNERASGDAANLKYMTDAERNRYAKGRVKTMRSKAQALRSESTNFAGSTAKTAVKGIGISLSGALGTASIAALSAHGIEAGVAFISGAAIGGVPILAVSTGVLAAKTISRGARYIKNINAIKNVKHK